MLFFFITPVLYCCFRNSEFNNTLLYQDEGRGNIVTRTSTYLSFKFVVETIRSLLLYACEVIYLINKSVISPYVQEQGGILLNFNIIRLYYHIIALELNVSLFKAALKSRSMFYAI